MNVTCYEQPDSYPKCLPKLDQMFLPYLNQLLQYALPQILPKKKKNIFEKIQLFKKINYY